jgi:ribose/xylose/arabinose/galactoside ABC-type transport system permease subunit
MSDTGADAFDLSDEIVAESLAAEGKTVRPGTQDLFRRIVRSREFAVLLVALALFLLFAAANPRFLSANNLSGIMRRMPVIGIVAVGMTFLMIAGEIDLSVGTTFGFLMTIIAVGGARWGFDPWWGMVLVTILGCGIGLVNGILVTRVRLPAFIATLGMMAVLRGIANATSGGMEYGLQGTSNFFFTLFGGTVGDTRIPYLFLIMLVVMAIGGFILAKTKFGSDVYATGGNREAAQQNGIKTDRVRLACFILTGGMCGLAGAFMYGRLGSAPVSASGGLELQVIAAIIIGGASLFGGRGSMFGSLTGTFFLAMLPAGLIMVGVPDFWEGVAIGIVILGAAGLDQIIRRSASFVMTRMRRAA